jgi:hypothetical protein
MICAIPSIFKIARTDNKEMTTMKLREVDERVTYTQHLQEDSERSGRADQSVQRRARYTEAEPLYLRALAIREKQ